MSALTKPGLVIATGVGLIMLQSWAVLAQIPSTRPAYASTELVLNPDVSAPHAHMGRALAIDGDWIMAGASGADHGGKNYVGAVYAFQFADSAWMELAKLSPEDGCAGEQFGSSVALDGDTLAVGAPGWSVEGARDVGAVYVFTRKERGWTQTAKLTPPTVAARALFGTQVALRGDTLAVAAPGQPSQHRGGAGAVFVYQRNTSEWRLLTTIESPTPGPIHSFGAALALSLELLLVRDSTFSKQGLDQGGIIRVFSLVGGQWSLTATLEPPGEKREPGFGRSIAVNGKRVLVGATDGAPSPASPPGLAYLFECENDTWRLTHRLRPSDSGPGDAFGYAVALDADRAVVSAVSSIYTAPVFGRQALYVFERRDDEWRETARIAGSNKETAFGASVAITARWIASGAPGSLQGKRPGAVHVFSHAPDERGAPTQRRRLTVSVQSAFHPLQSEDGQSLFFGYAAALHSSLAVVTAPRLSFRRDTSSGMVWIFEYADDQWREAGRLTAGKDDRANSFGISAATDGRRVVVGVEPEFFHAPPSNRELGGAHVFERVDGSWRASARLRCAGADAGCAVAIDGDVILIADDGRPREGHAGVGGGGVFVYERSGDQWAETARLTAPAGESAEGFGAAVALRGRRAIVGAPEARGDEARARGAAFVYSGVNGAWTLEAKLTPSDSRVKRFGASVAMGDGRIVIGAPWPMENSANRNTGSVFTYELGDAGWRENAQLRCSDTQQGGFFGGAVALNERFLGVGMYSPGSSTSAHPTIAAYLYEWDRRGWREVAAVAATDVKTVRGPATLSLNSDFALIATLDDQPRCAYFLRLNAQK